MTRSKKTIIVIIAILAAWFFIRFVFGGSEDTWMCRDGEWVKHGFPSASKPEGSCDWSDNLNPLR